MLFRCATISCFQVVNKWHFQIFSLYSLNSLQSLHCLLDATELVKIVEIFKLVRSCFLGSSCNLVKTLIVSFVRQTKQGTRSPIELFWTSFILQNYEQVKSSSALNILLPDGVKIRVKVEKYPWFTGTFQIPTWGAKVRNLVQPTWWTRRTNSIK